MAYLVQAIKQGIADWLQEKENELIGGVLFSDTGNGQILLFEKFGVCTQNNLSLKSEITNHYVEDNVWINDHWAISPMQYTLSGLVGELIYTVPNGWAKKVESFYGSTGLGLLSKISPKLGSYTQSALNIVRKAQSVTNKYISIAKSAGEKITNFFTKGIIKKANQRKVLDELENLMNNRVLVNVSTPYGTYNGLAIIAVNIRQGQETKFTSEVEITLQKWRTYGESLNNTYDEKLQSDIATAQTAKIKDKGLIGTIKENYELFNNTIKVDTAMEGTLT